MDKRSSARTLNFFCHTNSMWILIEDWMVEFAKNTLKIDKTETELKMRLMHLEIWEKRILKLYFQ